MTTVAELIARKYGLTMYHYDYHDARGHQDRRIARRVALGEAVEDPTPDHVWLDQNPEEMAAETLAGFQVRFEWALDDLRALFTGRPAIAEGWGLRPELVDSLRRMVVLVPTEDFRQHHSGLSRARELSTSVSLTRPAPRPTVSPVTGWSPRTQHRTPAASASASSKSTGRSTRWLWPQRSPSISPLALARRRLRDRSAQEVSAVDRQDTA
ncbi:hypothetical protein [Streptomyces sp. NPDC002403]